MNKLEKENRSHLKNLTFSSPGYSNFLRDVRYVYDFKFFRPNKVPETGVDVFVIQINFDILMNLWKSVDNRKTKKMILYNHLKTKIVCPKKLFIWDRSNEGIESEMAKNYFSLIKETLTEYCNIPSNKIIFLTVATQPNLPSEFKYYNFIWTWFLNKKIDRIRTNGIKDKKFLFLGGFPRWNKILLLYNLYKSKLLENSLWSCKELSNREWKRVEKLCRGDFKEEIKKSRKEIAKMLPRILDLNPDDKSNTNTSIPTELYETTYFSVVAESSFSDGTSQRYTEKAFKNFLVGHPFVIVSSPFTLRAMQVDGFKTFHPHIDETYDTILNPRERMDAILKEIERLSNLTDEQWEQLQLDIEPILEYNKNYTNNIIKLVKNHIDKILKLAI